jgi:type IV pilus assembly protein PilM
VSPLFSSLFGSERLIGIDLGASQIKLVQAEAYKDKIRIVRAAQDDTPEDAIKDGMVIDRAAVAGVLKRMMKAHNITATGAVLAVSGPTVTVRRIRQPKMSETALRKSARYEAAKYVPSGIEDSAIAVEILGMSAVEAGQMDVMLVVAPREMVESRIDAVQRAGLEVVAVDLEAFALERAVVDCRRSMWDDGKLRALVDIGATHTEVILLHGATFALTRSVPIAGNAFTDALATHLRVDAAAAEERKHTVNLHTLIDGGVESEVNAARAIQGVLDELLREIRRSISYYETQIAESAETEALAEIVLAGGACRLQGIAPYIEARLTTPTRLANPLGNPLFVNTTEAHGDDTPGIGIALGLAVKEFLRGPLSAKS